MTGLAQKGGAVISHIRIAAAPEAIHAVRVAAGGARLVLGCDVAVAGSFDALAKMALGKTRVVVNTHAAMTGDFTRRPDLHFPLHEFLLGIEEAVGRDRVSALDASRLAMALLGDSIASNLFMLGFAWQKGLVPIGREAIERAVELNGVSVAFNKQAFLWGRRAAHDLARVEMLAAPSAPVAAMPETTLGGIVAKRKAFLTDFQDAAYSERYERLVREVDAAERTKTPGRDGLAKAVARYLFKLMAYKDEYEVARLYTDGSFARQIAREFEGDFKLKFHLAPPAAARRDEATGHLKKNVYGPWTMTAFRLLAGLKGLRGTWLDPFGRTAERRRERQLIQDYEATVAELTRRLDHDTHAIAVEIASIPEHIRGFGHVKERHLAEAVKREAELLARLRAPTARATAAE
jgi:indolepyruvate ferredoxin oxidoreductase